MIKRILVVDDNPEDLEMLRGVLGQLGADWQIESAESGAIALRKMFHQPFDIVVTDFLMPKMDGVQLLQKVKRQHPQTVRIMLSGYFDWKATGRLTSMAHQYLSKPCDPVELRDTIQRALFLRELLASPALQRLVAQIDSLPSLPALYSELTQRLHKENPDTHRLGEIISRDPGLCTKVLQLVNSAYFGLYHHIANAEEAVVYLGLNPIKSLVLSLQIFAPFDRIKVAEFSFEGLWNHCWRTGKLAQRISLVQNLDPMLLDQAFTAGLLHDIGKLVLVTSLPDQYRRVLALQQADRTLGWEAELKIFGCTHAEVGAYLLRLWGLPDPLVEAVALHHRPAACASRSFSAVTAVHVANALTHEAEATSAEAIQVDLAHLTTLGLSEQLDFWRTQTTSTFCEQAA